jgi:hypothetical protein
MESRRQAPVSSAALLFQVGSAYLCGDYRSNKSRLACERKITDMLLNASYQAALSWLNVGAVGFDIRGANTRAWLCHCARSREKQQGSANRQNS